MEENYLLSLFIAFIFGAMFFKKDSKTQTEVITSTRSYVSDSSKLSGVDKYLQSQKDDLLLSEVSGVEKYLENKQNLDNSGEQQEQSISGVARYLSSKDDVMVSSVSKYMAQQAIQAKEMAKLNVSGVEKYLNNRD